MKKEIRAAKSRKAYGEISNVPSVIGRKIYGILYECGCGDLEGVRRRKPREPAGKF